MYDTIKFSLRNEPTLQSEVIPRMENMREVWNGDLAGNIDSMNINISSSYITFEGSLSKYYTGGEQPHLTANQTEQAMASLSDRCGIDMDYASVRRLDVAANLSVTYSPQTYYQTLVSMPKYIRDKKTSATGVTIYFDPVGRRKSRTILLYKKAADLLRYELQIKRRNVVLGMDVKGRHLYDSVFRKQCADVWKDHIFRIYMQNPTAGGAIPFMQYDSMKEIREYLVSLALAQNPDIWVPILENCKDRKLRYSANRIRKCSLPPCLVSQEDDLVGELKNQIELQYLRMIEDIPL